MEILIFLLGAAFGLGIANLALLLEAVEEEGWSIELAADAAHEIGAFVFLFALLDLYKNL